MKRFDASLLTGIGVLAVHQIAYSASSLLGAESAVGHGHLAAAWLLGGFVAVAGLARSVTRSLRNRKHAPASLGVMSLWVVLGYAGMESVERILDGSSVLGLAGEAVFWFGLLAAPLVAAALRSMTRSVHELAGRLIARHRSPEQRPDLPPPFAITSVELAPLLLRSDSVSRRGPPRRSHI